jgi:hypothetical protein
MPPPRRTLQLPETNQISALLADVMPSPVAAPTVPRTAPADAVGSAGDFSSWDFDNPVRPTRSQSSANLAAFQSRSTPVATVLPPPKLSSTPAVIGLSSWSFEHFVLTANWCNDPHKERELLLALRGGPASLSGVNVAEYFGLMNWRNDPNSVRSALPAAPRVEDVPTDGRRAGTEWTAANVLSEFVWE